jgi:hypothetical protein
MNELIDILASAENDIGKITWEGHHPEYPQTIIELMNALGKSTFIVRDYRKHSFKDVLANIESSSLEQLSCAITSIVRSERFITGGWKAQLENKNLQNAVRKAIELSANNV